MVKTVSKLRGIDGDIGETVMHTYTNRDSFLEYVSIKIFARTAAIALLNFMNCFVCVHLERFIKIRTVDDNK